FRFQSGANELRLELRGEEPVNGLLTLFGVPSVTLVGNVVFDNRGPEQPQVQIVLEDFVPTLTWTYPSDPPPLVREHVIERRVRGERDATDYEVVAVLGDEQRFVDTTFENPIIATELDYRVRALNGAAGRAVGEASVAVGTVVAENLGNVWRLRDPVTGGALLLSNRFDLGTAEIIELRSDGTVAQRVAAARPMGAGVITADGRLFVVTEERQRLEEWSRTTFEPLRDVIRLDELLGAFTTDAAGRFYTGVSASDPDVGMDVLQIDLDTGERTRLVLPRTNDGFPSNIAGLIVDRERLYVVDNGLGFSNTRGRILVYDVSGAAPQFVDVRRDPDAFSGVVLAEDGAALLLGQQPGRERPRWIERWDAQTLETLGRYEVVMPGDDTAFFFASVSPQPLVGFAPELGSGSGLQDFLATYRRFDSTTGQFGSSTFQSRRGAIVDLGTGGVFSIIGDLDGGSMSDLWQLPLE
ncbi:MAG: hypothetical protein AAGF99_16160, partial [Bacteroidota bacterium]